MVLDSSAIVALVLDEPGSVLAVGAPTVLETTMVLSRVFGGEARKVVESLLASADVEVLPFTSEHAATAHEAFLKFGKGRHPASLNYGDCMAYAIASVSGHPLLFVGADLSQTDITPAG